MPVEMDYGQLRCDKGFGSDGTLVECGLETGDSSKSVSNSGGGVCNYTGSSGVDNDVELIIRMGHR